VWRLHWCVRRQAGAVYSIFTLVVRSTETELITENALCLRDGAGSLTHIVSTLAQESTRAERIALGQTISEILSVKPQLGTRVTSMLKSDLHWIDIVRHAVHGDFLIVTGT
jgi:hypothetical protein